MAILVFSPRPFGDTGGRSTAISLSRSGADGMKRILSGSPLTCTKGHVDEILRLADDRQTDSDLKLLAAAIVDSGCAYVRFL